MKIIMNKKIAIPIDENGDLDGHFGHCKYFELITVEENKIIASEKLTPPPHEPGILPRWLASKGATDILAGGMGQKAIQIFNYNNVNVFVGAPKLNTEDLVNGFLDGTIAFNANYCDH
jgi:predicted Fe-Mo cluster-binding NifX family protein